LSNLGRLFSFTLYLPLMLWGLFLTCRRWRAFGLLYLYVGFDTLLHLTSWAAPRYRLPSDAVMMLFVGVAAVGIALRIGVLPSSARGALRQAHAQATPH
jgi:hypothetical protein